MEHELLEERESSSAENLLDSLIIETHSTESNANIEWKDTAIGVYLNSKNRQKQFNKPKSTQRKKG